MAQQSIAFAPGPLLPVDGPAVKHKFAPWTPLLVDGPASLPYFLCGLLYLLMAQQSITFAPWTPLHVSGIHQRPCIFQAKRHQFRKHLDISVETPPTQPNYSNTAHIQMTSSRSFQAPLKKTQPAVPKDRNNVKWKIDISKWHSQIHCYFINELHHQNFDYIAQLI